MSFLLRLTALLCPAMRVQSRSAFWRSLLLVGATLTGALAKPVALPPQSAQPIPRDHSADGLYRFRHEMPLTIRADHPAILPVAAAIRAVTLDPLEQIVMVNDVTHLLVDYDDDERVYQRAECHATLDEMIARRREAGWIYLRDDCDGRAVFAAHLLAALGIKWQLAASYWQGHAWVIARVGGVAYDLLELGAEKPVKTGLAYKVVGRHFVHPAKHPPYFPWRLAWRERTGANIEIGKCLGLLELDATPTYLHERWSRDWTKLQPGGNTSPFDPRMLSAAYAGFPLGEPLKGGGSARDAATFAASGTQARPVTGRATR